MLRIDRVRMPTTAVRRGKVAPGGFGRIKIHLRGQLHIMQFCSFAAKVFEFRQCMGGFVKMFGADLVLRVQNHAFQIRLALVAGLTQKQIGSLRILHHTKRGRIHAVRQRIMRPFTKLDKFRRRAAASRQQQAAEKQRRPDSRDEVARGRHGDGNLDGDRRAKKQSERQEKRKSTRAASAANATQLVSLCRVMVLGNRVNMSLH